MVKKKINGGEVEVGVKYTLKVEAFSLGSIQEPDDVIRVRNGAENELFLPAGGGIVGDDTGLELRELVGSTSDPNHNGGVLLLICVLEDLLDPTLATLERRFESDLGARGGSDSELLDDIAGLEHVAGPLVGF